MKPGTCADEGDDEDEDPASGSTLGAPLESRSVDREKAVSEERFIPLTLSAATDIPRPKSAPLDTPDYR